MARRIQQILPDRSPTDGAEARRADRSRSRIVLVGVPYYEDPGLADIPVIANNVDELYQVLTDPQLGGFDSDSCVPAPNDVSLAEVGGLLAKAAAEAEDLLLFYFSGHGLLEPRRRELYLSLSDSRPNQPRFTALPFEAVRDVFLDSRAAVRVVILDSCFSGRAIGEHLAGEADAILGQLQVAGTYTLTAAPGNRTALTIPGEEHTAFTGRLLRLLRTGSPAAGESLSLGDIYRHLQAELRAEGLPVPQQCGTETADLLGLVRNLHPRSGHHADSAAPAPRTALHLAHTSRADGTYAENGRPYFLVHLYLASFDAAVLDEVTKVVYHLHPTFPDPDRTITDGESAFSLKVRAWGDFHLTADVHLAGRRTPVRLERYLNI
ncbi:pYEATS domain-containing protein [Kitasatospora sp. MMS16-BH015]|uniref:caspase, EACC1-associated type n=1 Tax=Kitasatospora sp. MMS16-BH015 TaxID=2018025 RepID=UPI00131A4A5E|nr:pYEATS domain-containing protein [Kitasatospora sp. MMS16-BH015]